MVLYPLNALADALEEIKRKKLTRVKAEHSIEDFKTYLYFTNEDGSIYLCFYTELGE